MRLLLDTHMAIWWEAGDPRLAAQVVDLVRNQAEEVFVSRASLWEMAIKISIGRLKIDLARFAALVGTQS